MATGAHFIGWGPTVRGREALAPLGAGEELVRVIQRGDLVVERLGVAAAYTGDDLARLHATSGELATELAR